MFSLVDRGQKKKGEVAKGCKVSVVGVVAGWGEVIRGVSEEGGAGDVPRDGVGVPGPDSPPERYEDDPRLYPVCPVMGEVPLAAGRYRLLLRWCALQSIGISMRTGISETTKKKKKKKKKKKMRREQAEEEKDVSYLTLHW